MLTNPYDFPFQSMQPPEIAILARSVNRGIHDPVSINLARPRFMTASVQVRRFEQVDDVTPEAFRKDYWDGIAYLLRDMFVGAEELVAVRKRLNRSGFAK
jgi:hypothetical protein